MISKNLLLIYGDNKISFIDTNQYKLIRIIDIPNSSYNYRVCLLNKNILLMREYSKCIRQ